MSDLRRQCCPPAPLWTRPWASLCNSAQPQQLQQPGCSDETQPFSAAPNTMSAADACQGLQEQVAGGLSPRPSSTQIHAAAGTDPGAIHAGQPGKATHRCPCSIIVPFLEAALLRMAWQARSVPPWAHLGSWFWPGGQEIAGAVPLVPRSDTTTTCTSVRCTCPMRRQIRQNARCSDLTS